MIFLSSIAFGAVNPCFVPPRFPPPSPVFSPVLRSSRVSLTWISTLQSRSVIFLILKVNFVLFLAEIIVKFQKGWIFLLPRCACALLTFFALVQLNIKFYFLFLDWKGYVRRGKKWWKESRSNNNKYWKWIRILFLYFIAQFFLKLFSFIYQFITIYNYLKKKIDL